LKFLIKSLKTLSNFVALCEELRRPGEGEHVIADAFLPGAELQEGDGQWMIVNAAWPHAAPSTVGSAHSRVIVSIFMHGTPCQRPLDHNRGPYNPEIQYNMVPLHCTGRDKGLLSEQVPKLAVMNMLGRGVMSYEQVSHVQHPWSTAVLEKADTMLWNAFWGRPERVLAEGTLTCYELEGGSWMKQEDWENVYGLGTGESGNAKPYTSPAEFMEERARQRKDDEEHWGGGDPHWDSVMGLPASYEHPPGVVAAPTITRPPWPMIASCKEDAERPTMTFSVKHYLQNIAGLTHNLIRANSLPYRVHTPNERETARDHTWLGCARVSGKDSEAAPLILRELGNKTVNAVLKAVKDVEEGAAQQVSEGKSWKNAWTPSERTVNEVWEACGMTEDKSKIYERAEGDVADDFRQKMCTRKSTTTRLQEIVEQRQSLRLIQACNDHDASYAELEMLKAASKLVDEESKPGGSDLRQEALAMFETRISLRSAAAKTNEALWTPVPCGARRSARGKGDGDEGGGLMWAEKKDPGPWEPSKSFLQMAWLDKDRGELRQCGPADLAVPDWKKMAQEVAKWDGEALECIKHMRKKQTTGEASETDDKKGN
jgi:hypothetical protein